MHDLAVIVISTNEAHWLTPCLTSVFEHAGRASLDVVVVDNESTDDTARIVHERFPQARLVRCDNHGFGHANNRGAEACRARYVLYLNCDTEVAQGTFGELIEALDARPDVGIAGLREVLPDGTLFPTIRRFPSPLRALAEAFALPRLGETVADPELHGRETECDWTIGAGMVIRREALLATGGFDERFFMSSEDTDLCRRARNVGFRVVHLPVLTIVHHVHGGERELSPQMAAQYALSRRLYVLKHLSPPRRFAYLAATALRYALRAPLGPPRRSGLRARLAELRYLLRMQAGRATPPFEPGTPPGPRAPS